MAFLRSARRRTGRLAMALYSAEAVLQSRSADLWEPVEEKLPLTFRARGAALSRPLRLPRGDHRRPNRPARRRHHPPQASEIGPLVHDAFERPRVHAPLPPARTAQGVAQGTLLRPLASRAPASSRSRPPDAGA